MAKEFVYLIASRAIFFICAMSFIFGLMGSAQFVLQIYTSFMTRIDLNVVHLAMSVGLTVFSFYTFILSMKLYEKIESQMPAYLKI